MSIFCAKFNIPSLTKEIKNSHAISYHLVPYNVGRWHGRKHKEEIINSTMG
jgi:hypothetical protein